jgi:ferredoxin
VPPITEAASASGTVRIDRSICQGHGSCVLIAPHLIEIAEDGRAGSRRARVICPGSPAGIGDARVRCLDGLIRIDAPSAQLIPGGARVRDPGSDHVTPTGASGPVWRDACSMVEGPSPLPHLHDEIARTTDSFCAALDTARVHGVERPVAAGSDKP